MENRLLPIGSVIEYKGRTLSVIGYTADETENGRKPGYVAVPYPVGFMGSDRLLFIPSDADHSVISEGYRDASGEFFGGLVSEILPRAAAADVSRLEKIAGQMMTSGEEKE